MRIFYGGIEFKSVSTLPGTRRDTVRDRSGLHYLLTKHRLNFLCLYNPVATVVTVPLAAAVPLAPLFAVLPSPLGRGSPAFTDTQLRDLLRQDRRQLLIFEEDGQLLLQSPMPAPGTAFATLNVATNTVTIPLPVQSCDATGGPRILKCDVVEAHGIKTYTVHFEIETDLCEWNGTEVLAHSWNTRLAIDQDGMATRLIEGQLKFRLDELLRLGRIPDHYRTLFGHPVPDFFARTGIDVFDHEDGTTVDYQVTDTQRHFNLGVKSPATRFEAFLTGTMETPGPNATRLRLGAGIVERLVGLGGTFAQGRYTSVGAGVTSALVDVAVSALTAELRANLENCPRFTHGVVCRAWGPTNVSRIGLSALCIGICYGRLGVGADAWRTEGLRVTHELSGKFAEAELTFAFGLEDFNLKRGFVGASPFLQTGLQGLLGVLNFVPAIGNALGGTGQIVQGGLGAGGDPMSKLITPFAMNEELKDGWDGRVWASQTGERKNPPPPWNRATTGSWVANLVAQVLFDAASSPPAVPDVRTQNPQFVNPDTGALGPALATP